MKYNILLLLFSILCLTVTAQEKLVINNSGKFKIVQFTDVHWVSGQYEKTKDAIIRMNEVLDAEKPDFVIFTGDVIFSKPAKEALDSVFAPVIKRKIPFGFVFGNHDTEQDFTEKKIYDYIKRLPGNMISTTNDITGMANYIIPVYSDKYTKIPSFIFYCFNSHSYPSSKELGDYDWIHLDQIEWYNKESDLFTTMNNGTPIPSLAFFHIPLPEYKEAQNNQNALLVGTRKEAVCSPVFNSGLYTVMKEKRDILGCFVGHDHVNDYAVDWHGIMLAYGRYSGGSTVYNDIPGGNGARVIELTNGKREIHTWIRLKGGKIINDLYYPQDTKPNNN